MNNCVLIGRCSKDIELRFIPSSGMAVAKFSLAVDKGLYGEKKQQAEAKGQATADFINITVFGKSAENCANYLAKGSQCGVQGRISTGSYTKDDGTKVYTTEILADKVEFLGSKSDGQAKPKQQQNESYFDDDVFTPVDDSDSELPF